MTKYLRLNDIEAYTLAFHLSNDVWQIIRTWDKFSQWTIGKQFTEAIDSIAANIAEGFGRYSKKDKVKFYRYAYGSTSESLDWNEKAFRRGILSKIQYQKIYAQLKVIPKKLHSLINFTNSRLTI